MEEKKTHTCVAYFRVGNKEQCTEQQMNCEQPSNEPSREQGNTTAPSGEGSHE